MLNLAEVFEKYEADFLKFEEIENPRFAVPDICAFIMLADLDVLDRATGGRAAGNPMDVISGAEHDQIWLNTNCEKLAKVASEEFIRDLRRCGVFYDEDYDGLTMFV
jgi:hypothetical protein